MVLKSNNLLRAKVNKNFLIKYVRTGENWTNLIGAGQYHKLVGVELRDKHFKEIFEKGEQVYEYKIRGRLIIKFISK